MAAEHKKAIGRKIAELREARGWSQPALAAKIPAAEVDAQQVSKWERGVHTPSKHLEALAKALGVEEGEILSGKKDARGDETPDVIGALNEAAEPKVIGDLAKRIDQVLDQQATLLSEISEVRSEQEHQRQLLERAERGSATKRK